MRISTPRRIAFFACVVVPIVSGCAGPPPVEPTPNAVSITTAAPAPSGLASVASPAPVLVSPLAPLKKRFAELRDLRSYPMLDGPAAIAALGESLWLRSGKRCTAFKPRGDHLEAEVELCRIHREGVEFACTSTFELNSEHGYLDRSSVTCASVNQARARGWGSGSSHPPTYRPVAQTKNGVLIAYAFQATPTYGMITRSLQQPCLPGSAAAADPSISPEELRHVYGLANRQASSRRCVENDQVDVKFLIGIGRGIRVRRIKDPADCSQPCPQHETIRDFLEVKAVLDKYMFRFADGGEASLHRDRAACVAEDRHRDLEPRVCVKD